MSVVVTGASGHLGRLVVLELLGRGVPAGEVVATARDTSRLADLADRGVDVRRLDYDDTASVASALRGAEKVLLVSGTEFGKRVAQHTAVVEAAKAEGVALLAYTSAPKASTTTLRLAAEHAATEEVLRGSGVPFTLLRNGWYLENYTGSLAQDLERGGTVGSAGDGRVSAAARADYAAAAAVVLTTEGHAGAVYELGGDEPFTMAELAAEVASRSGRPFTYTDLPLEEHTQVLVDAGLPRPVAETLADSSAAVGRGELLVTSGDLARLTGRPATTLAEGVEAALAR